MSDLNTRSLNFVNLNQAKLAVKHLMMRRLVPLLLSKPGLGKSLQIHSFVVEPEPIHGLPVKWVLLLVHVILDGLAMMN